jgi:hypothetical protein
MSIVIKRIYSPIEALLSKPFIANLDNYYPDINNWYHYQIVGQLDQPSNILLQAYSDETLIGICIGKKSNENKLRCVRVSNDFKNTGLGVRLINTMLEELEDTKPLITVSEELLHEYSRVFHHYYNFRIEEIRRGVYRRNKLEYVYNNVLV